AILAAPDVGRQLPFQGPRLGERMSLVFLELLEVAIERAARQTRLLAELLLRQRFYGLLEDREYPLALGVGLRRQAVPARLEPFLGQGDDELLRRGGEARDGVQHAHALAGERIGAGALELSDDVDVAGQRVRAAHSLAEAADRFALVGDDDHDKP